MPRAATVSAAASDIQSEAALTLARLLLFHRRKDGCVATRRGLGPGRYGTRIGSNAERPEEHASQQNPATPSLSVRRSVAMLNQVPTLPALGEQRSVLNTVSKRARTPLRSPICARGQKCLLVDNARDEIASDMCESSVTSKSHGRVCKLIDLVLSSSRSRIQSELLMKRTP